MRNLATVQTVSEVRPVPNADSLDVVRVLGWECVAKRGEFAPGDRCVYFEIDSLLPQDVPAFAFMAKLGYRVRTIKLRGQISQGLALPISTFPWLAGVPDGDDVSSKIGSGVTKYETAVHPSLGGTARVNYPCFIRKTDEPRIQGCPWMLARHADAQWYVTEKIDGTSFTAYWHDDVFGVCSRNLDLIESEGNAYWAMARKAGLPDSLPALCRSLNRSLAIQSEMIGPKIQANKYARTEHELYVFGVWDCDACRYVDLQEMLDICEGLRLRTVPILMTDVCLIGETVDSIVAATEGESVLHPTQCEGHVYRTQQNRADYKHGHASFKAINPSFLLRHGE
jgi:RNA ligase (TIGR02306 family)